MLRCDRPEGIGLGGEGRGSVWDILILKCLGEIQVEISAGCWRCGRETMFIDLSLNIELQGSVGMWEIVVVIILVKMLPFIHYSSSSPPFQSQSFYSWTY